MHGLGEVQVLEREAASSCSQAAQAVQAVPPITATLPLCLVLVQDSDLAITARSLHEGWPYFNIALVEADKHVTLMSAEGDQLFPRARPCWLREMRTMSSLCWMEVLCCQRITL